MGLEVRGMDGIGAAPSRRGLYGSGEEEMGTDWSGGDRKGTDGMGQVSQSKEIVWEWHGSDGTGSHRMGAEGSGLAPICRGL